VGAQTVSGLVHTMAAMGGDGFRVVYGTAHWDGTRWRARVGGNLLDPRWLDPIQPIQGGNLVIAMISDGLGQSSALVLGGYTDQPRPSTGSVVDVLPAGPGIQIVFMGANGVEYTTDRFIGSYMIGDPVYLNWDADKATIMGKIGAIAAPPPPVVVPPPPPAAGNGTTALLATASDTWGVGGWGRWATSRNGGEDVFTGTQGGYTVTGSWFYGAPKPELAGKTATRIRFRLPARISVGSFNAAATIHFYAHTSGSRPGGDVARTVGPHDVSIPAGWGGDYVDLPTSFGPVLAAGGGISIAGDPYAAFNSRLDDPESGKVLVDWTA